jgi:hypothetical protein
MGSDWGFNLLKLGPEWFNVTAKLCLMVAETYMGMGLVGGGRMWWHWMIQSSGGGHAAQVRHVGRGCDQYAVFRFTVSP